ncbi:hypothetical protein BK769_16890 [Bacillus thuringiensis serovar kumamtoensis]|uniref:Uncharacterized protein n=1 Tax=Bacillus thuringiensis serovar kumamotoensis TaxID=132267 RepID=A0A9X6PQK6_BACUK|nr:hypothetical protein BK769_16890 [Bacillus thuringiensis serovar kumamtoensis]
MLYNKQNRSSSTIISYFLDIVPHLPTCLCFFKLCNRARKSKVRKEVEQYLRYHFNMKVNSSGEHVFKDLFSDSVIISVGSRRITPPVSKTIVRKTFC